MHFPGMEFMHLQTLMPAKSFLQVKKNRTGLLQKNMLSKTGTKMKEKISEGMHGP